MRTHATRVLAVSLCLAAANLAAAATIQVLPGPPGNNPGDAFDVSNPGINYAVGAGTILHPAGYDVRDIFGGQFSPYAPERGHVVFADNEPVGTVSRVIVTLPSPITLGSFDLYVAEDINNTGRRSARKFRLYAGNTLIKETILLDNSGTQTYTTTYGGTNLKVSETLASYPASDTYTLELEQNQLGSNFSGVRITEFDAHVPEPMALPLLALAALLSGRRRAPLRGQVSFQASLPRC